MAWQREKRNKWKKSISSIHGKIVSEKYSKSWTSFEIEIEMACNLDKWVTESVLCVRISVFIIIYRFAFWNISIVRILIVFMIG